MAIKKSSLERKEIGPIKILLLGFITLVLTVAIGFIISEIGQAGRTPNCQLLEPLTKDCAPTSNINIWWLMDYSGVALFYASPLVAGLVMYKALHRDERK